MAHPLSFLAGAGLGAGVMYYFDPDCGGRRRSYLRDQFASSQCRMTRAGDVLRRDASNRFEGTLAEIRAAFRHDQPPDEVLVSRVRARLGRSTSHPSAIVVDAHEGCVRLSGPVLVNEVQNVVRNVRRVRGVQHVENALEVHEHAGNVPALQGGVERYYQPFDVMQQNWSPTTRAAVGVAAAGMMATCLASRSVGGIALGTIGCVLAMRATNRQNARSAQGFIQQSDGRGQGTQGAQPSNVEQSPNLAQRASEPSQQKSGQSQSPKHARGAERAGGSSDAGIANPRSATGQPSEPAVHNL
jgi:hypothetical protein